MGKKSNSDLIQSAQSMVEVLKSSTDKNRKANVEADFTDKVEGLVSLLTKQYTELDALKDKVKEKKGEIEANIESLEKMVESTKKRIKKEKPKKAQKIPL